MAVVAGGPVVVALRHASPSAEVGLRVGLAALAALGLVLLLAKAPRSAAALFGGAALLAMARVLTAGGVLSPGHSLLAYVEGAEMALTALGLRQLVRAVRPAAIRISGALVGLAFGAFALKLAWAMGLVGVVRFGGLGLLPLALVALVGTWRALQPNGLPRTDAHGALP